MEDYLIPLDDYKSSEVQSGIANAAQRGIANAAQRSQQFMSLYFLIFAPHALKPFVLPNEKIPPPPPIHPFRIAHVRSLANERIRRLTVCRFRTPSDR